MNDADCELLKVDVRVSEVLDVDVVLRDCDTLGDTVADGVVELLGLLLFVCDRLDETEGVRERDVVPVVERVDVTVRVLDIEGDPDDVDESVGVPELEAVEPCEVLRDCVSESVCVAEADEPCEFDGETLTLGVSS